MKIITSVLTVLFIVTLGVGTVFYLNNYKPLAEDYARMKSDLPAFEKAGAELKKLKEKENRETAWIGPVVNVLNAGLGKEINSGKAEVLVAGNAIVVNIAEEELYLPNSYTFAKESPQLRSNLAVLLKHDQLKGKNIYIGNTTGAVPSQGKGRKRIPAKDARTLAAERSAVLVKNFEKNGVNPDALITVAYSAKQPTVGSKIKNHKTVLIIENALLAQPVAAAQEAESKIPIKTAPETTGSVTAPASSPASHPKPIPIQPAQPKIP